MIRTWSFLAALLLLAACLQTDTERQMESESYVVQNAMIWTGKPLLPWALAMVVTGDTIAYVGSPSAARRLAGDAPTIDAGGQLIVPGFIDAHVHFLTGGANLSSVQLRDAASPQDFISRIAAFADSLEPGTWITGGDWDHTGWGGTLPERSWIDSVTVNNPVWVNRLDGHMALANSAALEEAGVPASPGHIPGGEVVRNESGTMTGILKDNAMRLVARAVPDPTPDQVRRALASASMSRGRA
jgi:predicted amidohydrolase YtcJ